MELEKPLLYLHSYKTIFQKCLVLVAIQHTFHTRYKTCISKHKIVYAQFIL